MGLTVKERNEFITKNEKLIHSVCSKFRNYNIVEYEDLFAQAQMIALDALSKFDNAKAKNVKLSTYVYTNIKGYLQQYLVRNARSYRIRWHEVSTVLDDFSVEDLIENNKLDTIGSTCNTEYVIDLVEIKTILSKLEYDVLLSEYDLDVNHKPTHDYAIIGRVKPSLLPLIKRKLQLNLGVSL